MEMTASEWLIAIAQVALVVAVSFAVLCLITSLVRFQMMTEQARETEELGQGEDRSFRLHVLNRIPVARKARQPISVMMLRVPGNGTRPPEVQAMLKSQLRAGDVVNVCGENLVGILLGCGSEKVGIVAKRVMDRALADRMPGADAWRFGVAGYPDHGYKTSEIYSRALAMIDEAEQKGELIAGMSAPESVADDVPPPADMIDSVTGLIREEKMIGVMRRYIAGERRDERPVSMIYFDIDQYTPLAGQMASKVSDALLKEMAVFIGVMIREQDMIARFGDGGFIVAMPSIPDAAMIAAQRVVHAVRKNVFKSGSGMKVSISAGVAGYPDVVGTAVQYFVAAEAALKSARQRGRNQCIKYDHTMQVAPEGEKSIDHL